MPTVLPERTFAAPEPEKAGTLIYAAAVLLMLVISGVMLMPHEDGTPVDTVQTRPV